MATQRQVGRGMSAGSTAAYAVAFTPDGRTLVSTDTSGSIRQWSVATHRQVRPPIIPPGGIEFMGAALSPGGEVLLTTRFFGPAQFWKLAAARRR